MSGQESGPAWLGRSVVSRNRGLVVAACLAVKPRLGAHPEEARADACGAGARIRGGALVGVGANGPSWVASSSAEHRDHLGREPLELLRVVDKRVEQNQLRTGVRHGTDAGGALLGRAREDVF